MMCGLIDLNSVNNDDDETAASSSDMCASSLNVSVEPESVCMELWHACAGPLISLPKKGSSVVYFPQGHLEQLSDQSPLPLDLPSQVFCRVLDVKLHAEATNDDVYAQVWLVPDSPMEQKWKEGEVGEIEEDYNEGAKKSVTPHMFCKTLTASDTSTHGGFSVPRRAAEDCFPPLDYTQQRPSQVLVAKDLHGFEWNFRHIYRGQPRRHLLTTGWSAFVNRKKLISGDAVLFLRGADGELRLGIRRATSVKTCPTYPAALQFNANSFTVIVNAISKRNTFNVCYSPRTGSSEFIVPYPKFARSVANSLSSGMRFKMRFETEDAAEKRYTGFIVRKSDIDPIRWPGSKWRCLLVRWDDMEMSRLNRVSPWEIEPSSSFSGHTSSLVTGMKRTRAGLTTTSPEYPVPRDFPDGNEASGMEEGLRLQKVLQGQEVMGFNAPYGCRDLQNHRPHEMNCYYPGMNGSGSNSNSNGNGRSYGNFGESLCVNKVVLQGQEIFPNSGRWQQHGRNESSSVIEGIEVSQGWPIYQGHQTQNRSLSSSLSQMSSPASVLMFQQPIVGTGILNKAASSNRQADKTSSGGNFVSMCKDSCRLFGFPLTEGRKEGGGMGMGMGMGMDSNNEVGDIIIQESSSFGEKSDELYGSIPIPIPILSEMKGSKYAQVSDLYAVRDLLLDIAL